MCIHQDQNFVWQYSSHHSQFVDLIIHNLLKKVCENVTLDRCTVQWWYKYFREGRASTEDNLWSGHPSTAIDYTSIAIVTAVFDKDWYIMVRVREIKAGTRILRTTVHHILTEHLFKKKVTMH